MVISQLKSIAKSIMASYKIVNAKVEPLNTQDQNMQGISFFSLVCRTNRGEGVRCCSEAFTVAIHDRFRLTSEIVYHV